MLSFRFRDQLLNLAVWADFVPRSARLEPLGDYGRQLALISGAVVTVGGEYQGRNTLDASPVRPYAARLQHRITA